MTDATTNTGGGTYVGESVGTQGGAFTGRDGPSQQIHLQMGDRSPKEVADVIRRLQLATFGDIEIGIKGLVKEIERLSQEVKDLTTKLGALEKKVDDRVETSLTMKTMLYIVTLGVIILVISTIWNMF